MRYTSRLIASTLLAALLGTSEVWAQRTYVRTAPPPARVQVRGRSPGPGLCLATRLLPVETWRLPLETGHLGSSSGEACSVGLSSLGTRSPGLVQHAWILALRA